MRGVNLGGWFSQVDAIAEKDPDAFVDLNTHVATFLGSSDFARISSWGFDHVRLPVDYFNLFEGPELRPNERTLELLERALDRLTAVSLDVILDMHKCPGHDFHSGARAAQEFFTDPSKRDQAKRVWKYLAERFGSRRNVLLEILNEPIAEDSRAWDQIKDEMVAHLRRHAPNSTLVVGSNRWNNPREFAQLSPVADDNVLYSFHFYSPILFTHQRAPWLSGDVFRATRSYPGTYETAETKDQRLPLEFGTWDKQRMRQELDAVIRFREQHHVPVACNEFGVYVGGAERDSQLNWMRDFLSILQEHGIGYTYWNYKNLDFGLVSKNERRFRDFPQYQNSERTDIELLEVLRLNHTFSAIRATSANVDTGSFSVPTLRSADLHRS